MIAVLAVVMLGCSNPANDVAPPVDSGGAEDARAEDVTATDVNDARPIREVGVPNEVTVRVTLDGRPAPNTLVVQGGSERRWTTNAAGEVRVLVDTSVEGDLFLMASHPEARIAGDFVPSSDVPLVISLVRFEQRDNASYVFQDPGEPTRNGTTAQCAHCHITINSDWIAGPHRTAASNSVVHDLYAGTAATFDSKSKCDAAGGRWRLGIGPGTGAPANRCYVGDGALPALDGACGASTPCDGVAKRFGGCADCHAPAIDGKLGGRDLLEAKGLAFEYGVHCDVCHRVESIDLTKEPGTLGRLRLLRPSEPGSVSLGVFSPLTFGPSPDSPNPRMGSVQRDHFKQSTICAGCHEQQQAVLAFGGVIDATRWPSKRLPVHTTHGEWLASPMNPGAPCQMCHMPPDPTVWNSADLQLFATVGMGPASGWKRPPGSVHHHSTVGPRSAKPPSGLSMKLEKKVLDGTLTTRVTVQNDSAGHAIPTGEPLRAILLVVDASCDGSRLTPTGGAVVPDFGGYLDRRPRGIDWSTWPGAKVGDVVRVVRRTGAYYDYVGFGPFGDGTFAPANKGMPVEEAVGSSIVTVVSGDRVTFDKPLAVGDVAYRVEAGALPKAGIASSWAGAPGFAFARVMVSADGRRMVPHFLAVDVASDNRLLPKSSWTSEHRFATSCPDPTVRAVLVHRPMPSWLVRERGWSARDAVVADSTL